MSIPVFDATNHKEGSGVQNCAVTVGATGSRIMIAIIDKCFDNAPTYCRMDGVDMTPLDTNTGDNNTGQFVYYALAPATGSRTIEASVPSFHNYVLHAVAYHTVNQTTPFGTAAKQLLNPGSSISMSPTSTTNDLVISAYSGRDDAGTQTLTITPGGGETTRSGPFGFTSGGQGVVSRVTEKNGASGTTSVAATLNAGTGAAGISFSLKGTSASAGLVVSSNKVKSNGASAASAYWGSTADGKAHVKIATLPASGERASIVIRAQSGTQTSYRLDIANVGGTISVKLVEVTAGVEATLSTAPGRTWSAGERIGIIAVGSSLKGYYLGAAGTPSTDVWTEIVSMTDSSIATGRWGLEISGGTTVELDDWYYTTGAATSAVGRSLAQPHRIRNKVGDRRLTPYAIGLAHVGSSRRLPSIIKNRVPGIRRLPYDIGLVEVVQDPETRCGFVTRELYEALGPLAYADAENDYALWTLCCAVAGMLQPVEDLARDMDGFPGWSKLLNLPTTPVEALDWLGQFAGVGQQDGLTTAQKIQRIAAHEGFQRGTIPAMRSAGQLFLTGNKTVTITERTSNAYNFQVSTIPSETPYPNLVYQALLSQKPAGLILTYVNFTGQTYAKLKADFATYTLMKANYPTYDGVRKDIP